MVAASASRCGRDLGRGGVPTTSIRAATLVAPRFQRRALARRRIARALPTRRVSPVQACSRCRRSSASRNRRSCSPWQAVSGGCAPRRAVRAGRAAARAMAGSGSTASASAASVPSWRASAKSVASRSDAATTAWSLEAMAAASRASVASRSRASASWPTAWRAFSRAARSASRRWAVRLLRCGKFLRQTRDRALGLAQGVLDLGQAVALAQALRRGARRSGGAAEPVPAPQAAVAADQALARLEQGLHLRRTRPRRRRCRSA